MRQDVAPTEAEPQRSAPTEAEPQRSAARRPRSAARPPSVEAVLTTVRPGLVGHDPAAVTVLAREVVAEERHRLGAGGPPRSAGELGQDLRGRLDALSSATGLGPMPVINATGVILHTNLGRAPWPDTAIEAARSAARDYLLLELEPDTGRRGRRYREVEEHLVALTGAEDAVVVNNNAAAVALAVGLAGRRGVAVARGELVEIGGGVRIPEIVRRAGARLVEVGTTNRTRLADFAEVLAGGRVAVVLRVHPSNFRQSGFVESPEARPLAALAHEHGALVVDDLGSGALLDTAAFGLAHEPMPSERLAAGADVVTFSGDKLVGGPQAGLVVGRADPIARLRRDPLARALRPDKTTLAALAATLGLYRAGVAVRDVPVWRMIAADPRGLRERADGVAGATRQACADGGAATGITVVAVESTVGGGSLPGEVLPSWAVSVAVPSADRLAAVLRGGRPAVVGRVAAGALLLDLRTVAPSSDAELVRLLVAALAPPAAGSVDRARPVARRSFSPG